MQSVEDLNKLLITDDFYGTNYTMDEKLIFVRHSIGSIFAMKIASKLSTKGSKVNSTINFASPINGLYMFKYDVFGCYYIRKRNAKIGEQKICKK